jgi:hypothetical protein
MLRVRLTSFRLWFIVRLASPQVAALVMEANIMFRSIVKYDAPQSHQASKLQTGDVIATVGDDKVARHVDSVSVRPNGETHAIVSLPKTGKDPHTLMFAADGSVSVLGHAQAAPERKPRQTAPKPRKSQALTDAVAEVAKLPEVEQRSEQRSEPSSLRSEIRAAVRDAVQSVILSEIRSAVTDLLS